MELVKTTYSNVLLMLLFCVYVSCNDEENTKVKG